MNYTKGEWSISYGGEVEGRERYAVTTNTTEICQLRAKKDPKEIEANAYLISAAPDMYEALKTVREQVANFLYPKVKLLSSKELIVLMDKALAKAEGKEGK